MDNYTILFLVFITSGFSISGLSQNGTLMGVIKDSTDGNSVPFAKILIMELSVGA